MNDNEKKGWLLSGYKIDPNYKKIGTKKAQDEISEISAQSDPTQYGPTFWRPALVACAIDSLTDFFRKQKLSFWQIPPLRRSLVPSLSY